MALTPRLVVVNDCRLQPRFAAKPNASREPDAVESHDNPVVLAGFGRFGHIVGRLLRANGFGVTVLDNDPDQVESLAVSYSTMTLPTNREVYNPRSRVSLNIIDSII